jgi:hypothetical protein
VFNLANNWLKLKALPGGGYASTYATKVDKVKKKSTPKGETKNDGDKQQGKQKTEGKVESERKPRTKKIECFICGDDHYATDCPHRKKLVDSNKVRINKEEDEAAVNAVWEANAFVTVRTYQINAVGFSGFKSTEVLLDNQADISIIRPELLRQVQPTSEVVRVNGVGGVQLELRETGYLDNFFQVYTSTETRVNVLSFSDVEELYPITYGPFVGFTVHTSVGDMLFEKKGKMHVADFTAYGNVLATQVYTKVETARAHAVQELVRNAGYPSYQEVINLLQDGNFSHLPNLMAKDVRRAYDLFGKSAAFIRGRMTKQAAKRAVVEEDLVLKEKNLILHSDVMHIDKNLFLVTVCDPLQLTLQVHIERDSHAVLGMALQGQLELLYSKGFKPIRVYVDPQSALKSLETKFPNVSIDVAGAKDYVPKADIKIRRIKERYRSIKTSLAWNLPMILVKNLVAFAVSRINIERSATIDQTVAPKVLFTGLRLDFRKELGMAFGDYCKVFDGTDNTSRARSVPCIALYPCNNAAGSWAFFNLITRQRIRRSQWQKMVTTEGIIGQMNGLSEEVRLREDDVRQDIGETKQVREMQWQEQERATIVRTEEVQPIEGPEQGVPLGSAEGATVSESQERECPELVPQEEDDDSDDEMEVDGEKEEEKQEIVAPR